MEQNETNQDLKSLNQIRANKPGFGIFYRLVDMIVVGLTLYISARLYTGSVDVEFVIVGAFGILCFLLVAESSDLYRCWQNISFRDHAIVTLIPWVITAFILAMLGYFTKTGAIFSRVVIGVWLLTTPCLLLGWRFVLRTLVCHLYQKGMYAQRAAIIGVTTGGYELAKELQHHDNSGINLVGFFDERSPERIETELNQRLPAELCGTIEDALERAKKGDLQQIYIAMPLYARDRIKQLLARFSDTTANTYLIPDFFDYRLLYSRWVNIGKVQVLSVYDTPFNGISAFIKRAEDIVLSTVILTLISPVLLAVAIGVKLSSPGPVIFKQDRYGLDGKRIKVWKFRSMTCTDNGNIVKQATKNDPRVTRFGAFIRRTSLDELPQFFNVLRGTMSIVGPRPHAVAHNEEYRTIVERYMLRHKVKPGITGWAQINGFRGETDTLNKMESRVKYDLAYIERWSLLMDLKIILATIHKGFTDDVAY